MKVWAERSQHPALIVDEGDRPAQRVPLDPETIDLLYVEMALLREGKTRATKERLR